jgi:hypothetical protein
LQSVLRSFVALERERTNAVLAGDAIQRLRFGWITLDAAVTYWKLTPKDATSLQNPARCVETRTVSSRELRPRQGREIVDAIKTLASAANARPRAMILSREPWLDMLLVPARMGARGHPDLVLFVQRSVLQIA